MKRKVLLVIHPSKSDAADLAAELAAQLDKAGFEVLSNFSKKLAHISPLESVSGVEVAVVLGGDGTILRAAEIVQGYKIPILGINMGTVGFLAEISRPSVDAIVTALLAKSYSGEERLLLKHSVERKGAVVHSGWALNEVTVGRNDSQMVELFVQIDGRPLSRWGCDGVIAATPTGSTAYAFQQVALWSGRQSMQSSSFRLQHTLYSLGQW